MNYNPATPLAIIAFFVFTLSWIKLGYALGDWLDRRGWSNSTVGAVVLTFLFLPAILLTGFIS